MPYLKPIQSPDLQLDGLPTSVLPQSREYGAMDNFVASIVHDTWMGQAWLKAQSYQDIINEMGPWKDDPNYDAITDPNNQGYEQQVIGAKSAGEAAYMRRLIDYNTSGKAELDYSGAGVSRFMSQFVDPLTYTPIPFAKGLSFVPAFKKAAPYAAASIGASEGLRYAIDPTMSEAELAISLGAGTLLGASLAGGVSHFTRRLYKAAPSHRGVVNNVDQMNGHNKPFTPETDAPEVEEFGLNLFPEVNGKVTIKRQTINETIKQPRADGTFPAAFHRRYDDGRSEIFIDEDRIRVEFQNKPWTTPKELADGSMATPLNRDFQTPEDWINFNIAHEKAHVVEGKQRADETLGQYEDRVNATALREFDRATSAQFKSPVPEKLLNNKADADERLAANSIEFKAVESEIAKIDAEIKPYQDKIDADPTNNKGGRITKLQKKIDELKRQRDFLDAEFETLRLKQENLEYDVVNAQRAIDEFEINPDSEALGFMATGLGERHITWSQLPFYVLKNTKLRELAPQLAGRWMAMAHKIAGSPGLMHEGARQGIAVDSSVEMLSKHWHWRYRTAIDATEKLYMKYAKGISDATRGQVLIEKGAQAIQSLKPSFVGGAKEGGEKLSIKEFRAAVGRALMDNDRPTNTPEIDEAVRQWRAFFDEFEVAAKETGVFQSARRIQKDIDKIKLRIQDITLAQPADVKPSAQVKFTTEKGSTYVVNQQGRTVRTKRSEGKGQGTTYDPMPVMYVSTIDSKNILGDMAGGQTSVRLGYIDNGKFVNVANNQFPEGFDPVVGVFNKNTNKIVSQYSAKIEPSVGLHPVEKLYNKDGTATTHVGNSIVKIDGVEKFKPQAKGLTPKKGKQAELEELLLKLDDAEESLVYAKMADTSNQKYFHRIWRLDEIERNPGIFLDKLRTHFRSNPHVGKGGVLEGPKFEIALEARVQETYATIRKEAIFQDTLGMVNKGDRASRIEARIAKLEEDIATGSNMENIPDGIHAASVKKEQIRLLKKDLEKGGDGVGGPTPTLTRKLDINEREFDEFLEQDVDIVAQHYTMRMAPAIEMSRKFGDIRIDSYVKELSQELDNFAAANPDKAEAVLAEKEKLIQATHDLRDKVLGVYGIPDDPSALTPRTLRALKAWNVLTLMGKAWMAALADAGRIAMSEGFTRTFGGMLQSAMQRAEKGRGSEFFLGGKEVEMAGEAMDIVMATRFHSMTDMEGAMYGLSKAERGLYSMQGPFFLMNMLSVWTDNAKRFAGSLIQSRMIEDSIAFANGTLPKERMTRLAAIGIDKEMATRFVKQWQQAGETKGDHLFLANTENWADQGAVRSFRAMLAQEVNTAVITPHAADKLNFMSKPMGSVLMQYRGFGLSATQRIMGAALQQRDKSALAGVASMIGLAAIVDNWRRPDYVELDIGEVIFRAVETSGVTGVFSDINSALEIASGQQYGLRPMLGFDPVIKDPTWAQRTGAPLGAVGSQWLQFAYALTDREAEGNDVARGIRYMLPYQNLWFWSDLWGRAQRSAAETIDEE